MAHANRLSQLVESDHRGVTPTALKAAQVLLTKTGTGCDVFLRQPLFTTQTGNISPDQLPHIHRTADRNLHILSLSTLVCLCALAGMSASRARMDRTQIVTAAIFAGVMAASPVAAPLRSAIFSKLARSPESQVGIDKIRADRAFARLQTPLQSEQSSELFQGLSYLLNDKYAAASPILGKYALLGDARAQSAIGAMYYAGMGFPIDRQEGIKWFQLAALQGGKAERDALLAAVNGTWQWDKTGSEPSYSASVIGDPAAQPNYNARSYPPADASVLSSAAAPNIQIPTLGARKSIDDAYGANSATKGSEGYRGASGARYRYDLSNPGDQVRYSVDPGAQLRDSISVDPKRDLDRSLGQYGGDIQP